MFVDDRLTCLLPIVDILDKEVEAKEANEAKASDDADVKKAAAARCICVNRPAKEESVFDEEAAERGVSFCHTWGGLAGILRERGLLTEAQEGEVRAQCRAHAAFEPTEERKVFDSEWDPPAVPEAKKREDMTDGEKAAAAAEEKTTRAMFPLGHEVPEGFTDKTWKWVHG